MNYYVYVHKKPNGEIFYVGKGTKNRAWSKHGRNKHWCNVVNKYGKFTVEIVLDNLQEWYAFELEKDLTLQYREQYHLVNVTDGGGGNGNYKFTENDCLKIKLKTTGLNNGRSDKNIYQFVNVTTKETFEGTRYDFENKYGFKISDLFNNLSVKSVYSWVLKENENNVTPKYDPTEYTFIHKSEKELKCTRREFKNITGVDCKVLFMKGRKSVKGWRLFT